jgi:hypothetical protein
MKNRGLEIARVSATTCVDVRKEVIFRYTGIGAQLHKIYYHYSLKNLVVKILIGTFYQSTGARLQS